MKNTFFSGLVILLLQGGYSSQGAPPQKGRSSVRLVFVGDIMLDNLPGETIAKGEDPFAPFASVLEDADLTIGNLECPVATTGVAVKKPFQFRAHPRVLPVVKRHFSAVTIANNHSGDYGKAALVEMLGLLKKSELPFFGGGMNLTEAHTPLILERNGLRIAFLGYVEFKPRLFEAGASLPGVAWSGGEDEQVLHDIRMAREKFKADLVIPFMHWGWELEPQPCERQKVMSRKMIDAGADAVIGAHPHVTQGAEYYKGHLIVYSLGNFVFDGFDSVETTTGWVLRMTLGPDGLVEWDTRLAHLDEKGTPHPMPKTLSPCGKAGSDKIEMCRAE